MDSVCTLRSAQGVNIKHSKAGNYEAKLDSMAWHSNIFPLEDIMSH